VAFATKKASYQGATFGVQNTTDDLGPVRQPSIPKQIPLRARCTVLVIPCTEYQSRESGLPDRTGTHWARFHRHDDGAVIESPFTSSSCGFPNGKNFRMCGWIPINFSPVVGASNDHTIWINNDGANGHVVMCKRRGGFLERQRHEF